MLKGESKMIIPEEKSAFKVDDWVVMEQKFINRFRMAYIRESLSQRFSAPLQIIDVTINDKNMIVYQFNKKRFSNLIEGFRLATKSEIKNQQIKDVFLK
jgi:hypothetical protein